MAYLEIVSKLSRLRITLESSPHHWVSAFTRPIRSLIFYALTWTYHHCHTTYSSINPRMTVVSSNHVDGHCLPSKNTPALPTKRKCEIDVKFVPATSLTMPGKGFTNKRLKVSYGLKEAEVSCLLPPSFSLKLATTIHSAIRPPFSFTKLIHVRIPDKQNSRFVAVWY